MLTRIHKDADEKLIGILGKEFINEFEGMNVGSSAVFGDRWG